MTTQNLADLLARTFENRPLDCLPEYVPPLSGAKTQSDLMALAEFIINEITNAR